MIPATSNQAVVGFFFFFKCYLWYDLRAVVQALGKEPVFWIYGTNEVTVCNLMMHIHWTSTFVLYFPQNGLMKLRQALSFYIILPLAIKVLLALLIILLSSFWWVSFEELAVANNETWKELTKFKYVKRSQWVWGMTVNIFNNYIFKLLQRTSGGWEFSLPAP